MKISKLAAAIKKSKHMQVINTADGSGEVFQMVGYVGNLYRVENMPLLNDIQMLTFLGMEKEDKGSLNFMQQKIGGEIFHDDYTGEVQLHWSALVSDPELTVFWPDDISNSTVLFGKTESLSLAGITGSTRAFLRADENGTYIAIKEGMLLKALLAPQKVEAARLIERLDHERKLLERLGGKS